MRTRDGHGRLWRHPLRGLRSLAGRFRRDRSGATAVQAIVMMPMIIVAFWSMFLLWQYIQIRDTLHYATYQATRYLSLYPVESTSPDPWTEVAEKIVFMELKNNPFIIKEGRPFSRYTDYNVEVTLLNGEYECKSPIQVSAWLVVRLLPGGNIDKFGNPGFTAFRLEDVREGEVLCQ